MAATVVINEYNGAAAATKSSNIAKGHWLSIESASVDDAIKDANPIPKPPSGSNYSYEKWHKAEVTALGGSIRLETFRRYLDSAPGTGWTVLISDFTTPPTPTGTTPVNTVSSVAIRACPTADPGAARITGLLDATNEETAFAVSQAGVDNTATAGFSKTMTWAWAEVA